MHLIDIINLRLNYYILFFALLQIFSLNAQQEIYKNTFEANPLTVPQYTGAAVAHQNIISSVWTNNGNNLAFSQESGVNGNALGLSINGGSKYTLTLIIAPGETISLSGVNFWAKKSMANMAWTLYVNQTQVANGSTSQNGQFVGPVSFGSAMTNLSGTVEIEIDINGNGNGTYSLDEFTLLGSASDLCDEVNFFPVNNVTCELTATTFVALSQELMMSPQYESYQWKILDNGNYVPLINGLNYIGVNTQILSIINTPLSFDDNKYICEVTSGSCTYILGPINLNVYPEPTAVTIQFDN